MKRCVTPLHARNRGTGERGGREKERNREHLEARTGGPEWKTLVVLKESTEKDREDEKDWR